ncbi:11789_t:CDS:2 [Paraglomus brasilianum]|uniref:11789_t:CDS:1 n=1 Tax=Paraglomus brasilianum TaxID=144538 RepID=A0A9N8WNF4_9GLOM|nr:11789_t:CDS:2 [Paraglomus brasilianum]
MSFITFLLPDVEQQFDQELARLVSSKEELLKYNNTLRVDGRGTLRVQQYSKSGWASEETVWGGTNIRGGFFQTTTTPTTTTTTTTTTATLEILENSETNVYQEEVEYLLEIFESQGEETLEE